ncbi:MAG TPA: hypothetical protein DC063_01015 [Arenimonas sp.]|nr:hypothetical protein [Arenimonas sp.]
MTSSECTSQPRGSGLSGFRPISRVSPSTFTWPPLALRQWWCSPTRTPASRREGQRRSRLPGTGCSTTGTSSGAPSGKAKRSLPRCAAAGCVAVSMVMSTEPRAPQPRAALSAPPRLRPTVKASRVMPSRRMSLARSTLPQTVNVTRPPPKESGAPPARQTVGRLPVALMPWPASTMPRSLTEAQRSSGPRWKAVMNSPAAWAAGAASADESAADNSASRRDGNVVVFMAGSGVRGSW